MSDAQTIEVTSEVEAFGSEYFQNYSGDGRSYETCWQDYTIPCDRLAQAFGWLGFAPKSLLDLGAATGHLMNGIIAAVPSITTAYGVEISEYAVAHRVHSNVLHGDVMEAADFFAGAAPERRQFDLITSNVNVYLSEDKLASLLHQVKMQLLAEGGLFVFTTFNSPENGHAVFTGQTFSKQGDDVAPILARPRSWWLRFVQDAGFEVVGDLNVTLLLRPSSALRLDPELVEQHYPGDNEGGLAGLNNPVRLFVGGHHLTLALDQAGACWYELNRDLPAEPRFRKRVMEALIVHVHSGALGWYRLLRLEPQAEYEFYAQMWCEPTRDGRFALTSEMIFAGQEWPAPAAE